MEVSMKNQLVYVLMNGDGEYIAPINHGGRWIYISYSGKTTGFKFYSNIETAKDRLSKLNEQGNRFYLKCVDMECIPMGKRIIK